LIEFDEHGLMKALPGRNAILLTASLKNLCSQPTMSVAGYLENKRVGFNLSCTREARRQARHATLNYAATFGYSLGVGHCPFNGLQPKTGSSRQFGTGKRAREIEIPKKSTSRRACIRS